MIIIDVSNIAYAAMFQHIAIQKQFPLNEDTLRHLVLNSLRANVKKFKHVYAPTSKSVVLAFDSANYWRRDLFPHYKACRRLNRANSPFDWDLIHVYMNTIMTELVQKTPYTPVLVNGAEADDVIGTLAPLAAAQESVMIISGDKDFPQLQTNRKISQWAPVLKKFIAEPAPELQLKQLIIRGDKDDGIPNILSADDIFVTGGRQRPISEKKLITWLTQAPEQFCDQSMLHNYYRNQKLIDLTCIPTTLKHDIIQAKEQAPTVTKSQFLTYLIEKQLDNLIACVDEF